jgi:hypothetical protein
MTLTDKIYELMKTTRNAILIGAFAGLTSGVADAQDMSNYLQQTSVTDTDKAVTRNKYVSRNPTSNLDKTFLYEFIAQREASGLPNKLKLVQLAIALDNGTPEAPRIWLKLNESEDYRLYKPSSGLVKKLGKILVDKTYEYVDEIPAPVGTALDLVIEAKEEEIEKRHASTKKYLEVLFPNMNYQIAYVPSGLIGGLDEGYVGVRIEFPVKFNSENANMYSLLNYDSIRFNLKRPK